ncbi:DNA translocase FtsK [Pseudomonas abietaniphila]|uniref:Ftsk gamma domain-containing protein n=1 Tax=Pseudomonas abietaniphila TaxID=89065 RepID=A0A1G8TD41_9PSED|nr:DNA translocase FtsK [Pseudomonas abietaniphila]SDJ39343.1 Ftsk gamma domain-containing protein [Pseudomonas abietaniphila]
MTSREQFETKFPVPAGVTWNPETSRYVLTELRNSTVTTYEAHVERWVVWQAACESMADEAISPDVKALLAQLEQQERDNLLMATSFVLQTGRASISALQRNFRIGYGSACRLMDKLVERGVVTDIDSHGRREVISGARP